MEHHRQPFLEPYQNPQATQIKKKKKKSINKSTCLINLDSILNIITITSLLLTFSLLFFPGQIQKSFIKIKSISFPAISKQNKCPKVHPVGSSLNLAEWTRASWYVQEQQVTSYQKKEDLFCVVATYESKDKVKVPFFSGNVIGVHNYANIDQVNGEASNANNKTILCAREPDSEDASKLLVAPCFLPNFLAGDYWILAVGDDEGPNTQAKQYTWAAISGGQPTVEYPDGCSTKTKGTYGGVGLWVFARSPVASEKVKGYARKALKDQGYSLSQMIPVPQNGCKYEGAYIKK